MCDAFSDTHDEHEIRELINSVIDSMIIRLQTFLGSLYIDYMMIRFHFSNNSILCFHLTKGNLTYVQYDGSKDDLDWMIDFRYLNFNWFIKRLGCILIKSCFIAWLCLFLSFFNLQLDFIRTSFFIILGKKSTISDHFYRFYASFTLFWNINLHNFFVWKIAVKPVKIL